MTRENNNHNLIVGAAVVAGILGTLTALFRSNDTVQGWTEQAKDAATHVLEGEMVNKNLLLGGVAGGLIGAAAALLLAPKAGSELIRDLAEPFTHEREHARKRSTSRRKSASRRSTARKKETSHSHAHSHGESSTGGKSRRSTTKKRSPARRRTATAALKHAVATSERAVGETAAT